MATLFMLALSLAFCISSVVSSRSRIAAVEAAATAKVSCPFDFEQAIISKLRPILDIQGSASPEKISQVKAESRRLATWADNIQDQCTRELYKQWIDFYDKRADDAQKTQAMIRNIPNPPVSK